MRYLPTLDEHLNAGYFEWLFNILDELKASFRNDSQLQNFQLKSFDIMGDMRIPETSGMPCLRIIPDLDSIRQVETQTRRHQLKVDLYVFDQKPIKGEESYREHVQLVGRVYDVSMLDRQLSCLALDSAPVSVKTLGGVNERANAANFVSRIGLTIESDKNE